MKGIHITALLLLLYLLCSTQVLAQQKHFTLAACIEYAQQHNSDIQRAAAEQNIHLNNYRDAFSRVLPQISASTSAYINYGRGIDPKTNTYTNVNSFRNNYNIESSLLIFDGLASIYQLRSALHDRHAGQWTHQKVLRQVYLSTIEAYYNLLYTQELHRIAIDHLSNSEQLCSQAKRMLELGMKAPADLAEIEAIFSQNRAKVAMQQKQYELALLQLKEVMNYPLDAQILIRDSLIYTGVAPTLMTAGEIFAIAQHQLPEARIASAQLKSSQSRYKASIGAFAPRINLFAGWNTGFSYYMDDSPYENFRQQLDNRRGGYVGVSLSIDLFDGTRKVNELQRSKAEYQIQKSKSDDTHRELYKQIQEAILNLNAAVEEYRAVVESARHLEQVYNAARRNFQVGNVSSIDLSIASAQYLEAQNEVARKYTLYLLCQEWIKYYTKQ